MSAYHPKRKDKEINEEQELKRILKTGKYITLALANNNIPYIVTLSYGFDEEGNCLYFHSANTGTKLDYIEQNENTCGTIIEDKGYIEGQCDHDYSSLIIRGKIKKVHELQDKKHGLLVLLNHLERNPKPILERNIKNDNSYKNVTILKLEIESIIGKEYRK